MTEKSEQPSPVAFVTAGARRIGREISIGLAAARQLAPDIRVNAVAPGVILPPAGEEDAIMERLTKAIPLKTKGTPQDVVSAVVYLTRSPFVTGQVIHVGGGEHI